MDILFKDFGIILPSNVIYDINFNLENTYQAVNHITFLVNKKSKKIITYGFNFYFKTKTFPFSLHSEINTINKYYKNKHKPNELNSKKILIIIKISKIGIIGDSKPCYHCANYIYNNYNNLNLQEIYYSTKNNTLELLTKEDLINKKFKLSAGFKKRIY